MQSPLLFLLGASMAVAAPLVSSRQSNACFIVGNTALPASTQGAVDDLAARATCSNSATTLSGVPDVTVGSATFSNIDFSKSNQTPLEFALSEFAGATPLASSDLQTFKDQLDVYVATESGIRSVGGNLAIKVPKFFLEFQVSRIETAQGNPPTAAGLQVDHLLGKVLNNAKGEDAALLDQVRALAANIA
ncbi:hypothetical protein F5X68DRAFT_247452 [Plectosphaerella plurivora]|uniref:DUF7143 domain-containing protein n=1 Tax=Plectosphaerella plurivora TaxID=936078 RepID=A0A9P8V3X1_9PEZI|nr:hypothetical protein F5X68DRAFT_247452 [Plectosphaerella plurivora]